MDCDLINFILIYVYSICHRIFKYFLLRTSWNDLSMTAFLQSRDFPYLTFMFIGKQCANLQICCWTIFVCDSDEWTGNRINVLRPITALWHSLLRGCITIVYNPLIR